MWQQLKQTAARLKRELRVLSRAVQHLGTPVYAKAIALLVLAYALSPIDLIPDFIPVLGYIDDLLLVPAGIWLVLKMIPPAILQACRNGAADTQPSKKTAWFGATFVVFIWAIAIYYVITFF